MGQKNELRAWIAAVPMGKVNDLRAEIICKCKINGAIWGNWHRGKTKVPELAKPIIAEIAERNGLTPIYQPEDVATV